MQVLMGDRFTCRVQINNRIVDGSVGFRSITEYTIIGYIFDGLIIV